MRDQVLAGVDIGGTKTAILLSQRPPIALNRIEFPTHPGKGPEHTIRRIFDGVRELLSSLQLEVEDLKAIGVSCGSPLDTLKGIILAPPNLPTWTSVPIKSLLSKEFAVDCFVENDANAGALAEYQFGAGKGTRNMVFLTMGTGLGAGLILDGRIYRGASCAAGEIGHVRLTRSGPMGYHKAGSAEGWASGAGMARTALASIKKAGKHGEPTILARAMQNGAPQLSARDIWMAAQAGDGLAQRIVRDTGKRLGEVMAILIDVLNPDCIVVGGLALRMGEAILGPAREVVRKEALQTSAEACKIVPAGLGERVGDLAALCVAMGGHNDGQ